MGGGVSDTTLSSWSVAVYTISLEKKRVGCRGKGPRHAEEDSFLDRLLSALRGRAPLTTSFGYVMFGPVNRIGSDLGQDQRHFNLP